MDLAWSPHGTYLCSGSIDNKIIVWNVEKFPEKTVILTGHESFIKGVCWDPVGRYLASQSDDHTLRIWRTSDWKQETKLGDEIDQVGVSCRHWLSIDNDLGGAIAEQHVQLLSAYLVARRLEYRGDCDEQQRRTDVSALQ